MVWASLGCTPFSVEESVIEHVQEYRDDIQMGLETHLRYCRMLYRYYEEYNRLDDENENESGGRNHLVGLSKSGILDECDDTVLILQTNSQISNEMYIQDRISNILQRWTVKCESFVDIQFLVESIRDLVKIMPFEQRPLGGNARALSLWLYNNFNKFDAPCDMNDVFQHIQYMCKASMPAGGIRWSPNNVIDSLQIG